MIPMHLGSRFQRVFYWFAWSLVGLFGTPAFRWRMGFSDLPKDKPFLLVANHTSLMDPLWAAFWLGRRANFMASSALFRVPVLGKLLPLCGAFPKAKFVKDRESMQMLAERYEAGEVVVLFPEGTRTWDGRPGELLPGIGRLVKRLDANVVVARITNGHLYQPRWARYPRWMRVMVEHELLDLDTDRSPEAITADIADALRIDHTVPAPRGTLGFRVAHGLPAYLWACPSCLELEALEVDPKNGNRVVCTACGERWTVDVSNRLNGRETLRIDEAFDRLTDHFGSPPAACRTDLAEADTALHAPQARLLRLERGQPAVEVAAGEARLGPFGFRVGDRSFSLGSMQAVSVEVANTLTFRDDGHLYQLRVEGESPLKWAHFLRGWVGPPD